MNGELNLPIKLKYGIVGGFSFLFLFLFFFIEYEVFLIHIHGERRERFKETNSSVYPKGSSWWV